MTEAIKYRDEEALITSFEKDPAGFIEIFLERELSTKQNNFIVSTFDYNHVIAIWSRQTGKSTVIASYIIWRLLYGKGKTVQGEWMPEKIAILAPIKDQLDNLFDKIKRLVEKSELISSFVVKMNSAQIVMKNGNKAKLMSASPGSQIRGYTATCIVIDESQDIQDSKYSADILPFGATTNALIIEAGTPKTKNHFYNTIKAGEKKGSVIKVVRQLWFECPFLSKEYVMGQKEHSPDALWRQGYLCEFIEEGVLAFPSSLFEPEVKDGRKTGRWNLCDYEYIKSVTELTKTKVEEIYEQKKNGAEFVAGLDLGRQNDNTVLTIWRTDIRPIRLAAKISFDLGTQYKDIAKIVGMFNRVYDWMEINVDYTNEKSFIENLQDQDVAVPVTKDMKRGAIQFGVKNKTEMVVNVRSLLEKFQIQLPIKDERLFSQFTNQQFEITENNKYKFYHPSNEHDDELWSSLLALKNVSLMTTNDVASFVNPWEKKFDEVVHPGRESVKEALATTKKHRRYVNAEQRRLRSGTRWLN